MLNRIWLESKSHEASEESTTQHKSDIVLQAWLFYLLYFNSEYYTWIQNTIHEFRILYMNSEYYTWIQNTIHEFRILYMNSEYYTWIQKTVHKFRILYLNSEY